MRRFLAVAQLCLMLMGANRCRAADSPEILGQIDSRIEEYRKADAVLRLLGPQGKPVGEHLAVEIEQQRHKFLFGCNIYMFGRCATPEQNELYNRRFAELFNFATLGFYWNSYEPRLAETGAGYARTVARWCADNSIRTKGHPLLWTTEPAWLQQKPPLEAEKLLWSRISREVEAFAGLIDTWDVVNEPCVGPQQARERQASAALAAYQQYGAAGVVQRAFAEARRAGPGAVLVLNDYATGRDYESLIEQCLPPRAGGVEIDAIGIQSHMHGGYWGPEKTWQICERFSRFGKPIHFTELTILSGPKTASGWQSTREGQQQQAEQATQLFRVLFSHPTVQAITWWDFSDQGAWQAAPAGLLRADMTPKPAYEQLKQLVKTQWWTRAQTTTSTDSTVQLRGFLGEYKVSVLKDRQTLLGSFRLDEKPKGPIEVWLR